jgi:LPS-assembly protein
VREDVQPGFTDSSGLNGDRSDWLLAAQLTAPSGFLIDARSLWDDDTGLTVADGRLAWRNKKISLGANYVWQADDIAEGRDITISEWTFNSAFNFNESLTFDLNARYDVAGDRPVRGGIGVQWRNECVTIDVSASRRYTSSSTVDPTTTYGISGTVGGFSAGRAAGGVAARCKN